jgi:hypothetical protein
LELTGDLLKMGLPKCPPAIEFLALAGDLLDELIEPSLRPSQCPAATDNSDHRATEFGRVIVQ